MSDASTTRLQAIDKLCGPGQPYELKFTQIRGKNQRIFVKAPDTLKDLYAETRSDLDYLVFEGERFTFENVYQLASSLAAALIDQYGIKAGDRVAIAMRNYPEWVVAFFATTSIGALAVSLNAQWGASDLSFAIKDCNPSLLIADQERVDLIARVETIPPDLRIIRVRAKETNASIKTDCWNDVLAAHDVADMPKSVIHADDDATIIYTSGTTGYPKGVVSTHRGIIHALFSWELDTEIRSFTKRYEHPDPGYQECFLLTVPLFHVSGSHVAMLASLRPQRKMVCMYKWDVQKALALIEQERVTVLTAAPAITNDVIYADDSSKFDLSSLLVLGGGGAHRPPQQVLGISRFKKTIAPGTGWGMTETNAIGAGILGDDYVNRPTSCGQCSAVLEMRVVDETGSNLPSGQAGELQVRGASMFRGYWQRPESDKASFDGNWFRTGDKAIIDGEGFVHIVDRIKDLIIRGGENIACSSVEAALNQHPLVKEACAYGIPNERLGEEVGATLCVASTVPTKKLKEFLTDKLARFEIPSYIIQQKQPLPRGASGKIVKRLLQAYAIENLNQV